ncbi:MAG: DPP IV N-terminal domain-containing protein, partial [Terracidiphilus sp.]
MIRTGRQFVSGNEHGRNLASHALRTFARSILVTASLPVAISLFLLSLAAAPLTAKPLFGTQRNLTVDRIYTAPSLSGYLSDGIEWAPNSQRISFFDSDADSSEDIATLDVHNGRRKVLVPSRVLGAAMPPLIPSAVQSTGLGRVEAPRYLWSPLGNSLLLIGTDKLVLLDLDKMTPKTIVSAAPDTSGQPSSEIDDPKFSPDGKWISFVRGWNLWVADAATG